MGVGVAAEVVLASLMWMMSYTTSVRGGGWRDCVKRNVKAFGSQTRMREKRETLTCSDWACWNLVLRVFGLVTRSLVPCIDVDVLISRSIPASERFFFVGLPHGLPGPPPLEISLSTPQLVVGLITGSLPIIMIMPDLPLSASSSLPLSNGLT